MAIWKVSYVIQNSDEIGGIINLEQAPKIGEILNKYEKLQPALIPRLGTPLVGLAAHLAGGEDAAAECFRMLLELP